MRLNTIFPLVRAIISIGLLATPFPSAFCQIREGSEHFKKPLVKDTLVVFSEKNIYVKTLDNFDSIMVIHFHPTAQCSCCINVGNFSKKGLDKFYSKLYKDRRIIFRECNIDEDSLTAKKYKIFGSALGFKKLLKGKEEFKEIESVWGFCEDEEKFLLNFQKELNAFITPKKNEGVKKTTQ
ncbi:MAG: hypothetical protein V1890_01005 [Candidatus Zixiibacteriota bacterium]